MELKNFLVSSYVAKSTVFLINNDVLNLNSFFTKWELFFCHIALVTVLFSTYFSALSDKYGRIQLIGLGWLAYVFFYIFMSKLNVLGITIWFLFGFYGLFKAATEGAEKAFVADLTKINQRGTAFGWFNLVTGLMLFPASFIFGFIYEVYNAKFAFLFSAISSFIAILILITCKRKSY